MWNFFGGGKKKDEAQGQDADVMQPDPNDLSAANGLGKIQVNNVGGQAAAGAANTAPGALPATGPASGADAQDPEVQAALASIQEEAPGATSDPSAPAKGGITPDIGMQPAGGTGGMPQDSMQSTGQQQGGLVMDGASPAGQEAAHLVNKRNEFQPNGGGIQNMQTMPNDAASGTIGDTLGQKSVALETGMGAGDAGAADEMNNTVDAINDLQSQLDTSVAEPVPEMSVAPEVEAEADTAESTLMQTQPRSSEDNLKATIEALKKTPNANKEPAAAAEEEGGDMSEKEKTSADAAPAPAAQIDATTSVLPEGFVTETHAILSEKSSSADEKATLAALGKLLEGYTELGELVEKDVESVLVELVDYYRRKQSLHAAIQRANK